MSSGGLLGICYKLFGRPRGALTFDTAANFFRVAITTDRIYNPPCIRKERVHALSELGGVVGTGGMGRRLGKGGGMGKGGVGVFERRVDGMRGQQDLVAEGFHPGGLCVYSDAVSSEARSGRRVYGHGPVEADRENPALE